MVCLECGSRNRDASRRCSGCGIGFESEPVRRASRGAPWEYGDLVVRLPKLRWFQTPKVWLPIIEHVLEQAHRSGWQAADEIDVTALVEARRFRLGERPVGRPAQADGVVVRLKRQADGSPGGGESA